MLVCAADGWEAFEKLKEEKPLSPPISSTPADKLIQPKPLSAGVMPRGVKTVPPPSRTYYSGKEVNGKRSASGAAYSSPVNGEGIHAVRGRSIFGSLSGVNPWVFLDRCCTCCAGFKVLLVAFESEWTGLSCQFSPVPRSECPLFATSVCRPQWNAGWFLASTDRRLRCRK